MIAVVVVVIHEGFNAGLRISGEEVVFQQDAVVPSFNLALGLGMIRCAPDMAHALVLQPISQITGDVAGTVVRSQPEAFRASSSVSLTSSAFIDVHSFQAMI